ncbi:MAG: hypothetical protein QOG53_614 [Frankiales bacterium]|jgi:GNAT superfamily N-acetyltransferase|nr:hypothetical protein [Frankiales bacterium]
MVTVLAFASFEANPVQGTVRLFRGFAIQLAYRWGSHQVVTDDDHAVLMWSRLTAKWDCRRFARELQGVATAVAVGVGMAVLSTAIVAVALREVLTVAGANAVTRLWVIVAVVAYRFVLTLYGAWQALRLDVKRMRLLDDPVGEYWRIDYLAAQPLGAGHGSRLLAQFLAEADAADASICLVTDPRNRDFYRRNGFRLAGVADPSGDLGDRLLMVRRAPSLRRGVRRTRLTVAA